jgi:hypothetical protein
MNILQTLPLSRKKTPALACWAWPELRYRLAVLLLGEELARKVYGDLPQAG